jgi:amidase
MKWTNANTLCRDLQRGDASSEQVMAEVYDRIEAVNSSVNALVSLLPREAAMAMAKQADQVPVAERGPLHGLPMANKDMVEVEGFANTWGYVPWADRIAKKDDGFAARMRAAGALFIGRSNMPEFGLGSNTFNSLYGATLNPYDPTKTPGGSSGGAAVALATGMLPLADGSDMGGSLRNPASFCNVVGFRPSIGRMPFSRGFGWMGRLATTGPMARTVADTTLLFSVQAGPDAADPLTLPEPGHHFLDGLVPFENLNGLRVAYAPTLHGLPIDPEVMTVMQTSADVFSDLGAEVVAKSPPLEQAMDVFHIQRAAGLVAIGDALERR